MASHNHEIKVDNCILSQPCNSFTVTQLLDTTNRAHSQSPSYWTLHIVYIQSEWRFLSQDGLLDAFEKLRKATISFVISLCLSAPMKQLSSHWDYFHVILHLYVFFPNSLKKFHFH